MQTLPSLRMTEAEYLAYDLANEGKHELVNGEVMAMAGATEAHSTVQTNLMLAVGNRLRGGPCRVHGSDLRVLLTETRMYAYPDLTVVCGAPEFADTRPESLRNPRVIVEVLSASTESYDLGAKAAHYRHRASVDAVVFVDSRRPSVQLQTRNADGTWTLAEFDQGVLRIAALNLEIPLEELYVGLDFGPSPLTPR
jgi:Uma2 family endonuclease